MPASDGPDYPPPAGLPPAGRTILFVCTGNTCRSPLAKAICQRLLADALQCSPADLAGRGYRVLSAGIAAWPGDAASGPAVEVAAEFEVDLADHRSRPVNPELLDAATDVIAMTRTHAAVLQMRFPNVGPLPRLLAGDDDLDDPIGADLTVYRACARAIAAHLRRYLPEWVGS